MSSAARFATEHRLNVHFQMEGEAGDTCDPLYTEILGPATPEPHQIRSCESLHARCRYGITIPHGQESDRSGRRRWWRVDDAKCRTSESKLWGRDRSRGLLGQTTRRPDPRRP